MLKELRKIFFLGIAAGVTISLGGAVFLACTASAEALNYNRYIGATLFAVGLIAVCYFGFYLFTGKVCSLPSKHKPLDVLSLVAGLLGNYVGALTIGLLCGVSSDTMYARAQTVTNQKLGIEWYRVIILGFLCDILIYIAVEIFAKKKTPVGIIFAIPVFIICGFEHSIADMFYVSAARSFTLQTCLFILLVVAGNVLGGVFLPLIVKLAGKGREVKSDENATEKQDENTVCR